MPYEIWESSNENIVSIKNEILVGVAIGVATIKVTWLTDYNICFSFEPVECMNTLKIKENAETYIKIFATRFHSKCTTLKAINRKTGYELSAECHFKGIW